jgi:SAM-dependent methyltransferase
VGDSPRRAAFAVRVRSAYDAVASGYDDALHDEMEHKALDRALLQAFLELTGPGAIADVGCGPGQVSRFLAAAGAAVFGIDLSEVMVELARRRAADLPFAVGSMTELPIADGALAGAVAMYSIIHLSDELRAATFGELARVVRPGGRLLLAFHIDGPGQPPGSALHLDSWFDQPVDLDFRLLEPGPVIDDLAQTGFVTTARLDRAPLPEVEYPSRRCYLLAERSGSHSSTR